MILQAHKVAKRNLLDYVKKSTGEVFDEDKLTIGFARRFATYKRGNLIFSDLDRLVEASGGGRSNSFSPARPIPTTSRAREIITDVLKNAEKLKGRLKVVFLPNYDMTKGLLLAAGVDVWLNLPAGHGRRAARAA